MKRLAILGASGHGKVVAEAAELSDWDEVVFFDDAWPKISANSVWPVLGNTEDLLNSLNEFSGVAVAIGNNSIRLKKLNLLCEQGVALPAIIHPNAVISRYATIGDGSVVCAGVVVSADTKIGAGAILNTGCSIDHDCLLAEAVHISPGARLAGGTKVEVCAWVGIGAVVRQLISIGAYSVVGAGAAVVKDVPERTTVVGIPAQ
ncbi:acetyltransferase [Marinobacter sp. AL4B]|uniref:acetyltransferase n=1 Tax=Marinobacter sp. AL4B TaxID=2871173 RepID=UPI001CAA52C5|nr:acetyltransferase [Marinobacter sp. AL4B]MBZ0333213.1 acetyltransferase [Marinobacter sp. AL4B]